MCLRKKEKILLNFENIYEMIIFLHEEILCFFRDDQSLNNEHIVEMCGVIWPILPIQMLISP